MTTKDKPKNLSIGLTGGIGSGKSTAANLFAELGADIIDADYLARQVVAPGQKALTCIVEKFGPQILLPDDTLDRSKLRHLIFNDPEDRLWLQNLLHPLIRQEMKTRQEASHAPYCLLIIPLLIECLPNALIDRILVVHSDEQARIKRVMQRDHCSKAAVVASIRSQASDHERLRLADDILHNVTPDILSHQVKQLHERYLRLAK